MIGSTRVKTLAVFALLFAACAAPPRPTPEALALAKNPPASAEGRVVDREGRPVAGITVTAIPRGRDIVWPAPATTDADGRFVLTLSAPATYLFFLSRDGRAVITSEPDDPCRVRVDVRPGEHRSGILLVFLADAWRASSP
jgi:hypothetical protein